MRIVASKYKLILIFSVSCTVQEAESDISSSSLDSVEILTASKEDSLKDLVPVENIYKDPYEVLDSIVAVICTEGKDISEFPILRKNIELEGKLKIYCMDEESGGLNGKIHHSIVQWTYNGKPKAANLSPFIQSEFYKIIELDSRAHIYLLFGKEKESADCVVQTAYVIKINDNEIDLSYPAFAGRPYLNLCGGYFTFSGKTLSYKLGQDDLQENLNEVLRYKSRYRNFADDEASALKIYEAIESEYYSDKSFHLTFDGLVFIK